MLSGVQLVVVHRPSPHRYDRKVVPKDGAKFGMCAYGIMFEDAEDGKAVLGTGGVNSLPRTFVFFIVHTCFRCRLFGSRP